MKNKKYFYKLKISEYYSISEKISEFKINQLLQNLPHLRYLNLYYSNIGGNTWKYLKPNTSLRELHLTGCDNLTEVGVNDILNAYLKLISLNLSNTNIYNKMFKHLKSNTSLKRLDLSGCQNLTRVGFFLILTKCPQLTHLNLNNNIQITDNIVSVIVEYNKSLLSLSLRNTNISSKIFYFLESLTHLEKLEIDLAENNRLNSYEWLYSFELNLVNINVIELVIGNEEAFNLVKLVAKSFPRLKKLNISGLKKH